MAPIPKAEKLKAPNVGENDPAMLDEFLNNKLIAQPGTITLG
jgi:hypothetical protein